MGVTYIKRKNQTYNYKIEILFYRIDFTILQWVSESLEIKSNYFN